MLPRNHFVKDADTLEVLGKVMVLNNLYPAFLSKDEMEEVHDGFRDYYNRENRKKLDLSSIFEHITARPLGTLVSRFASTKTIAP